MFTPLQMCQTHRPDTLAADVCEPDTPVVYAVVQTQIDTGLVEAAHSLHPVKVHLQHLHVIMLTSVFVKGHQTNKT